MPGVPEENQKRGEGSEAAAGDHYAGEGEVRNDMIETDKIIRRLEEQIAVCKENDSDWITITVGMAKRILEEMDEKPAEVDVEGG